LRRDLLPWSLRKTFLHQFATLARPPPKPTKRKGGHWGDGGSRTLPLWRPQPIAPPKVGLAAFKHAQRHGGERPAQHGKAFRALAAVQMAAKAEWPMAMRLEMLGCKTPEDRQAWASRWGAFLGGQVQAAAQPAPERPQGSPYGAGGRYPS
jgi:hypothetical protein